MKRLFALIFILAFVQMAQAQEKGFSIGIGGSFDKHINEYGGFFAAVLPNRNYSDIGEYSFGVQLNYLFNDRLGIRSGVSYARKGYMLAYQWYTPDGSNGTGDPLIPLETEYRFAYLDIPIEVYYQVVSTNRYRLAPSVGLMNSILVGENQLSKMGDGSMKDTDYDMPDATSFLMGARLGLINDFDLTNKIFLSLEPYVMYNFQKLSDSIIVESDFAFGGYLSVNYRFNN